MIVWGEVATGERAVEAMEALGLMGSRALSARCAMWVRGVGHWSCGISRRCAQMRVPAIGCRGLLEGAAAHAAASVPVDR